jgi:hypothetical protein
VWLIEFKKWFDQSDKSDFKLLSELAESELISEENNKLTEKFHQIMRILRPISGDGVGGIPTVVFPQVTDEDATATTLEFTVTGTATENATHSLVINGICSS